MNEQELIEQLAHFEHTGWSSYMAYLFSKLESNPDGSLTIPSGYVAALQKQIDTPYADLPEREKQYDRDEVAHILPIIKRFSKENDSTITIDRDYLESLLNCLATQKLHSMAVVDTFTQVIDALRSLQEQNCHNIDEVQKKGRELLSNSLQDDMREERDSE